MEIGQTAKVCIFEMIYIYLLLVHIHNFAICPQAIVQQYFFFLQITRIFCFVFICETDAQISLSLYTLKNLPIIFRQNIFTLVRLFRFSQTKWTYIYSNMTLSMIFSAGDCFCTNILNIFIFFVVKNLFIQICLWWTFKWRRLFFAVTNYNTEKTAHAKTDIWN